MPRQLPNSLHVNPLHTYRIFPAHLKKNRIYRWGFAHWNVLMELTKMDCLQQRRQISKCIFWQSFRNKQSIFNQVRLSSMQVHPLYTRATQSHMYTIAVFGCAMNIFILKMNCDNESNDGLQEMSKWSKRCFLNCLFEALMLCSYNMAMTYLLHQRQFWIFRFIFRG